MEKDKMLEIVEKYIENEINYIQRKEDCTSLDKSDISDLYMLQNMTKEEKEKIVENVIDDEELYYKLRETIHYYLYY